ncbi:hypothetical protein [Virgisporangium aurantiacum]|uniref:Uncharacterized protein n=1 Tax=Virgisporangium aurantiacum TaxID=175570 RepID=A0A8J3ZJ49_9ACTN|nr:hypothetical protein [Virgisporangium aurantiacum]GIJ62393.1 hypothetical protein Vau01_099090 [Virgisporangium aurantiacum]
MRGAAIVRDDFTTNGHTVLWAASFGRLLNPTIAGTRRGAVGPIRPPFQINDLAQPQCTAAFDPRLAEFGDAVEHGGLGLAHITLDTITAAGDIRNPRECRTCIRVWALYSPAPSACRRCPSSRRNHGPSSATLPGSSDEHPRPLVVDSATGSCQRGGRVRTSVRYANGDGGAGGR